VILLPLTTTEAVHLRQAVSIALDRHGGILDAEQVDILQSIDRRLDDHEQRDVGTKATLQ